MPALRTLSLQPVDLPLHTNDHGNVKCVRVSGHYPSRGVPAEDETSSRGVLLMFFLPRCLPMKLIQ